MNILSRWFKKKQFFVKCTECGQEITGATENHCGNNFQKHLMKCNIDQKIKKSQENIDVEKKNIKKFAGMRGEKEE